MVNLQKGVLDKVEHFLERHHASYEVIVSDDGSTDGSMEFVEKFVKENPRFKIIKNPHLGKAGAVTSGMLKALGKYVLFTDMDQATPIEEMDKLIPFLNQNYDVVIGSRSSSRKGSPLIRRFISKSQVILRKMMVGLFSIEDTQCGFKMFTREASLALFDKIHKIHGGFSGVSGSNVSSGFDVELLYLASRMGLRIKEAPVNWLYVETRRVSPIKDSIEGVTDLLKIKKRILTKRYN
jgi:glycosyltransferase involved in cell wall biosynthesis